MRGCARAMAGRRKRHARAPKMQYPVGSRCIELKSKIRAQGTGIHKVVNSKIFGRCETDARAHLHRAKPAKETWAMEDEPFTMHARFKCTRTSHFMGPSS